MAPPQIDGHTLESFSAWTQSSDAIVLSAITTGHAPAPASPIETPAEAVARLAQAASCYQLIQLGICLLNEVSGTYVARPFTIDIFPADFLSTKKLLLTKSLFDCNAAHMKTLSDANFDFNRVLRFGMNWLSPLDEVRRGPESGILGFQSVRVRTSSGRP